MGRDRRPPRRRAMIPESRKRPEKRPETRGLCAGLRLTPIFAVHYNRPSSHTDGLPGSALASRKGKYMQFRFTRMIVLIVGLSLAATACGRYSIGSIRSSKAFKDGLEQYQKADYRGAAESFERSTQLSPDFQLAGFAYFYEGNSYDKMYRPTRKGEADNDVNLEKAVENYRKAIEKLASSDLPQAGQFRNLSFQYLVAAYGSDRLNDFSKAEAVAKELIAAEPNEPTNYQAL